jgi:tight adherence protein B
MPAFTLFLMVAGLLAAGLLVFAAFAGPSVSKQQARRLESLRERHSRSSDVAAAAQLKRIFAQRQNRATVSPSASSPIPPCFSFGSTRPDGPGPWRNM